MGITFDNGRSYICIFFSSHTFCDVKSYLFSVPVCLNFQGPMLLQLITRFASSYCAIIEGTARDIETTEL